MVLPTTTKMWGSQISTRWEDRRILHFFYSDYCRSLFEPRPKSSCRKLPTFKIAPNLWMAHVMCLNNVLRHSIVPSYLWAQEYYRSIRKQVQVILIKFEINEGVININYLIFPVIYCNDHVLAISYLPDILK